METKKKQTTENLITAGKQMSSVVLDFQDIDKTKSMVVGGKGANLGALSRIEGIRVPEGFCVSTEAFAPIDEGVPSIRERLEVLSALGAGQLEEIRAQSAEIRSAIESAVIPKDLRDEISRAVASL